MRIDQTQEGDRLVLLWAVLSLAGILMILELGLSAAVK